MKKLGFIVLAVILVLGLVGVAYAWSAQNAQINGYAVTGQTVGGFQYGSQGPSFTVTDSNSIVHPVTANIYSGASTNDTLDLTISNLYPGCTITGAQLFAVWNYGTIPCTAVSAPCTYNDPQVVSVVFTPPSGSMMPGTGNSVWGLGSITIDPNNANTSPNSTYTFTVQVAFTAP